WKYHSILLAPLSERRLIRWSMLAANPLANQHLVGVCVNRIGKLESYTRWWDYTAAYDEMITRTHSPHAPWWLVPSDDKKSARINCITHILSSIVRIRRGPRDWLARADSEQAMLADVQAAC
ncbi:MAG: hypothetical protein HC900_07830, partial [Methylacidiphilales bacterium]|nr:hypothetical protein [Candidatus Methylacidiphilales bacterium]